MQGFVASALIGLASLACPPVQAQQSLHEREIGTKVASSFMLGSKTFNVPAGDWTLVAKHEWNSVIGHIKVGTPMAGVFLLEVKDSKITRGVWAQGNLRATMAKRWEDDPCKTNEALYFQKDLGPSFQDQFCLKVGRTSNFITASKGWRQAAHRWALDNKIAFPSTVVRVYFARVNLKDNDRLAVYFDPEADGSYLDVLARWGEASAAVVLAGISGGGAANAPLSAPYPRNAAGK